MRLFSLSLSLSLAVEYCFINAVVSVSVSVLIDHPLEYDSHCRTKHTAAGPWVDASFNISSYIDLISLTWYNLPFHQSIGWVVIIYYDVFVIGGPYLHCLVLLFLLK